MTIEAEIYTRLAGFAGLTALVGTNIHSQILPQDAALPAVAVQVISAVRESNFGQDTGDVNYRIQVDCYGAKASGAASATAVKEQVRAALQRYAGGNMQDCYVEGESESWEPEAKIFVKRIDFKIWFKE